MSQVKVGVSYMRKGDNGILAHWCPRYESGDMAVR